MLAVGKDIIGLSRARCTFASYCVASLHFRRRRRGRAHELDCGWCDRTPCLPWAPPWPPRSAASSFPSSSHPPAPPT